MKTISQLCNNRIISTVAVVAFILLFTGVGYLYFQKYLQAKQESIKPAVIATENQTPKVEIKGIEPRTDYEIKMLVAAKEYWLSSGGDSSAEVILRDFGCHAGVEAVKDGETVSKFQYDGKTISETKL